MRKLLIVALLTLLSVLGQGMSANASDTADDCIRFDDGGALGEYFVVNECDYTVIGSFCYWDDNSSLACPGRGGFGPIGPGESEPVSPPNEASRYNIDWCNYDDWPSDCSFQ